MRKVALLGLGIMGTGLAGNLLKHGYDLTVWNRTRSKAEAFAERGAQIADTPRQAAANAEVVIVVVGDDDASREVWLGPDGVLAGAKPGTILIECSTLSPDWVRELAALAADHGNKFLDAPMAGSKGAAANAQIVLLVGGEAETLAQVSSILEVISSKIAHLGPNGAGATWKLINNMMSAVHAAALAEGLTMAEAAGLNLEQVASLIQTGPSGSPMVQAKLPRMAEHRYDDTDFSLKWMHKDVRYALLLGNDLGVPLTTVQGAAEVYLRAREKGLDDQDLAAVIEGVRA